MPKALQLDSCIYCPYFKKKAAYTEDSWERPEDWFCTNTEDDEPKKIAGYMEWNDPDPVIPDFCPLPDMPQGEENGRED